MVVYPIPSFFLIPVFGSSIRRSITSIGSGFRQSITSIGSGVRRSMTGFLGLPQSSKPSSPPFEWRGTGKWVPNVPWSMASTAGVHSPPDDAPLYVVM